MKTAAEMYGGRLPIDGLAKPQATRRDDYLEELLSHAVPASDGSGLAEMRDRVLCRSALTLVHAAPAPEAPKGATVVRFVVVSGEDGRDQKELSVEGIDFRSWDELPIVPWCHQYEIPPVGRGLWRATYRRGATHELWSDVEFMPADLADDPHVRFAAAVGRMYAGGWMRGISAGWIPKKVAEIRSRTGKLIRVQSVTSEYVEQSVCPIPVDRWALAEAQTRSVITSDDIEVIGRSTKWRTLTHGQAYELTPADRVRVPDNREGIDQERESVMRAYKPEEQRVLVEERTLDPENRLSTLLRPEGTATATHSQDSPEGEEEAAVEPAVEAEAGADEVVAPDEGESEATPADPDPDGDGERVEDEEPAIDEGGEAQGAETHARKLPTWVHGPLSDELDLANDRLRGAVVGLVDASEALWSLTSQCYYQGRSVCAELGIASRATGFVNYDENDPSSPISLHQLITRQLNRIDGHTRAITESSEHFRDALAGEGSGTYIEVEDDEGGESMEAPVIDAASLLDQVGLALEGVEGHAGRKIARARRQELTDLLRLLRTAAKRVSAVLSTPEKFEEDANEEAEQHAVASPDDGLQSRMCGLVRRASGQEVAEREVSLRSAALIGRTRALSAGESESAEVEAPTAAPEAPTPPPETVKRSKPSGPLPYVAVPRGRLGDAFGAVILERLSQLRAGQGGGGSATE